MARLSRGKKREQKHAAGAATRAAAPIDVRVLGTETGPGGATAGATAGATVGGVPVVASAGEEIQHAVLNRLHGIALATGHPVLATVHDTRIGYVVPLRVDPDGSSHFTAEPVRTPPQEAAAPAPPEPVRTAVPEQPVPTAPRDAVPPPAEPPAPPAVPEQRRSQDDRPTHVLRSLPEPVRDAVPTFPLRAVPEPQAAGEPVPTFELRAVPEPAQSTPQDTPPGTVRPPTGEFGPPPPMDARPVPAAEATPETARTPEPEPVPASVAAHKPVARPVPEPDEPDPDPKPTPARGFDAVAEAVLGDEPLTAPGDATAPALLAEPVARINEAVKAGRLETATQVAEQTVAEASGTLGPEHPEVLRLRELTAYIAYLAGDPVRAFHLSLELAGIRRRTGDAEAAYGNVQSAATAWRAVREPVLGLELGRDLIGLWTGLTAEDGPAADDIEQLESARARMGRLTERARKADQGN